MTTELLIELFGYLGSTLVVVSMLMASVVKLRIVNTIGSVVSGTYALIIGSFPLALMNICLIVINVYNLVRLLRTDHQYDMIRAEQKDAFVQYFLQRNLEDIRRYFPAFSLETHADAVFVVFCNGDPAGILLGSDNGNGVMDAALDYSVPAYRDCSVGIYLYAALPAYGITTLTAPKSDNTTHTAYLNKMGFTEENGSYRKHLPGTNGKRS